MAGLDGEVEVRLVAVAADVEAEQDVLAGVGAAGAVDLVQECGQGLVGKLGHAVGERAAEGGGVGAEHVVESGVGTPQGVVGAVELCEHGGGAAERAVRLGVAAVQGAVSGHRPRLPSLRCTRRNHTLHFTVP